MTVPLVVLFDGVCNLCDVAVRLIIANDPRARFSCAPLQSAAARDLLRRYGRTPDGIESIVLIDDMGVHEQSDAALGILTRLRSPWPLAGLAYALPRSVRDRIYAFVARNRYAWFGQRDACSVPTPEGRVRFL
ncbi:MAG: thiol-disulfide oxidoreductase DCC family protein [Candidatus Velthaea sp.]